VVRVVLLTDFGTADGYAAAMAGIIATAAPDAVVEHASHGIEPGDIAGAALALFRFATRYPAGTVHLAVVDPGVGTGRRPLAATIDGHHYVAPDNGLLSWVLRGCEQARIVSIAPDRHAPEPAPTFHGRDIFAPAAARLARGEPVDRLGAAVVDPVLLRLPEPDRSGGELRGEVLHADRFGNLITNIPASWIRDVSGAEVVVRVDGKPAGRIGRTYGDVAPGEVLALVGSIGLLEVSVRDGSAAAHLGAGRGASVALQPAVGISSRSTPGPPGKGAPGGEPGTGPGHTPPG
jgi:S-adenosyl-L-methionine hydrolase (adenosine-forming)